MRTRRVLVAVSAAQLGCGLAGAAVAIARRRAYNLPLMHGDPARVRRDAAWMGTALSAPAPMLLAQAGATAILARRPDRPASATLGGLAAAMVPGYLGEALVRHRLTRAGWDRLESPLAAAGLALAGGMVALAARREHGD